MTLDHHQHPDDEALSSLLDGEPAPDVADHVDTCASCGARLDALGAAASLVGRPVAPVAPLRRELAIRRALTTSARQRRLRAPLVLSTAAALVLVLVAVALLGGGGNDRERTATGPSAAERAPADLGDSATRSALAPAPVDAGELGDLHHDDLDDRVRAALAAATTTPSGPREATAAAPSPQAVATPPCEAAARAVDPALGSLRLVGRGSFSGRSAVVLVFEVPGGGRLDLRAYVLAGDDCRVTLQVLSFSR